MRLWFDHFDGRGGSDRDVIDKDTGQKVGRIHSNGVGFSNNGGGIEISLFDEKYRAKVNRIEECYGFVLGVQTVLNRVTSVDDGRWKLERELDSVKERLNSFSE